MPPRIELVRQWLAKADDDLRLADMALAARPPVCWGAAFHAEQAVEKLLKALLTFHAIEFEKTHSIDYLLELCLPACPAVEALRDAAGDLTDYAVEARYPFPRTEPSQAEASESIRIARQARRLVHSALPKDVLEGLSPA